MKKMVKISGIALIIVAISVIGYMLCDFGTETTDDAQIEQYVSPVNVKVAGYIKEIRFTEHQHVKKGDTLMIIDDSEYVIALKQAKALLSEAQSGRKVVAHTLNTSSNSASVYDASIEEARLKVEKLRKDYNRHCALLEKNASTPVMVEQYKTELDMAEARLNALKRQQQTALSTVSEVSQRQENADAQILRAEAAVEMALLNVSYTVIVAPCDGVLGRRSIEIGQLVSPGQTVTTIVPDAPRWVIANFKETQITNMKIKQKAKIKIDALPDKEYFGYITAISPATGSKYSKLPTDNSAGNFVKIQQRIPVRIDFENVSDDEFCEMIAGMMCVVTIYTAEQ